MSLVEREILIMDRSEKYFLETELIRRLTSEFEKMYAGNNSESFKRMEYMRPITST